ncbi:hypothetical protein MMC10_002850 [Thelotrema lepadinum]|nr:hypothetical protein [Thelotrema lepadinum]
MPEDIDMEDDLASDEEIVGTKQLKSILKKTSKDAQNSSDQVAERNKSLAIYHATILEQQKEIAATVLQSIEELIEFPLRTKDAEQPDPVDVQQVKSHLSLFQPSDFDSAVQERNIEDKCGYMLCPKARWKQNTKAKFRIVPGRNVKIVEKGELEKWCSNDCGKRALYLRVQLGDTPLGERASKGDGGLKLYGEADEADKDAAQLGVNELTKNLDQLALERGDQSNSFRSKSVSVGVQERALQDSVPEAPSEQGDTDAHQKIEGFIPVTQGQWTMQLPSRPKAIDHAEDALNNP